VALLLQKKGITRVRPLAGGIDGWLAHKFPVAGPDSIKEAAVSLAGVS
jgi:rhodanese-related sulfurtransferase